MSTLSFSLCRSHKTDVKKHLRKRRKTTLNFMFFTFTKRTQNHKVMLRPCYGISGFPPNSEEWTSTCAKTSWYIHICTYEYIHSEISVKKGELQPIKTQNLNLKKQASLVQYPGRNLHSYVNTDISLSLVILHTSGMKRIDFWVQEKNVPLPELKKNLTRVQLILEIPCVGQTFRYL